ncbi:uncharacterized protein prss56 [Brachyhypopomus gauderio]|uniref:uncharacterized protein prss56 n=1 Tax=Brachyhypopomus gauderio TaxID=698409 RepID=UPI00404393CA
MPRCGAAMLLMSLLELLLIGWCSLTPVGRQVYRMPQSALRALSDRGTVVMEAALWRALSVLDRAVAARVQVETHCTACTPCLFLDCGQHVETCVPVEQQLTEPSCEVIGRAHSLSVEAERSWALSQACGVYHRSCVGEHTHTYINTHTHTQPNTCLSRSAHACSSRVLQCSVIRTLNSLDTQMERGTQAVCGQRQSVVSSLTQPHWRIMGGSLAPPGSWPWLVSLRLGGTVMCGAVLVETSWVLTAAHCFTGSHSESYWTAVVGDFDITKIDPDEQVMTVNRIITHPKFDPKTLNNDIALVELSSPAVLSERVTPICLTHDLEPEVGVACLVAGWGSLYQDGPTSAVVMEAQVPLLSQDTCRSALGKELLTATMFCAGYLSGGTDSCQGDSGGPLIFQDRVSGHFHLYGITSWGDGCGVKNKPGVYTRVTAFRDWILAEIHKSSGSREPTCAELLKTSAVLEDQWGSEVTSLCRFYILSCSPTFDSAACQRLAQSKCQDRLKKCQLRSILQTLLELLQRADGYLRDQLDLTFTQSLPQMVEHVYSSGVSTRTRRHTPEAGHSSSTPAVSAWIPPSVFEQVGPLVDDWENYLNSIADGLDQHGTPGEPTQSSNEERLFQPDEESTLHQLQSALQTSVYLLRSRMACGHAPDLLEVTRPVLQMEFSGSFPGRTEEPVVDVGTGDEALSLCNWNALLLQALTKGDAGHTEDKGQDTTSVLPTADPGRSLSSETLEPRTMEISGQIQEFRTQGGSLLEGIHSWTTSDLKLDSRLTVTRSTPTQHPTSGWLSSSRRKKELPRRRRCRQLSWRNPPARGEVCPGLAVSAQQVVVTKEMYSWILDIAPGNRSMTFQEVLVDLTTKNEHGLYEARVKVIVGGRPLTFNCHVGLASEWFYRSMPRVLALALRALQT